jgi:hypothetical protein
MKFLSRMQNKPLLKFEKYRENLRICGDFIYSYETPVAEIHHKAKEVIVCRLLVANNIQTHKLRLQFVGI